MNKYFSNKKGFGHIPLMRLVCAVLVLLSAVSCTDETKEMGKKTPLSMKLMVNGTESRAVIEDGELPAGSLVGVTIVDDTGTTYNGSSLSNLKGTTSGSALNLESDVYVTDTDATIYAYYPWATGVSETAIPMTAGTTDYLYATPLTGINCDNASATLTMNHALACLRIEITRGSYAGTGVLGDFTITSDALSTAGTLNARTGEVTASGENVYSLTVSQTLSGESLTVDVMVIPTGTTADMDFNIIIDDNEYYVTATSVTLTKGSMFEYALEIPA